MPFRRDLVSERIEPVAPEPYRAVGDSPSIMPAPWSPAQVIGLLVGLGFAVLGVAALARTGFHTAHIYTPREVVWTLPHTPLLAVIELAFGALMIIASVVPGGLRTLMGLLGAAALVLGVVVLVGSTPPRLTHWLAVNDRNGWLYTITGAVVLIAALASPVFFGAPRRRSSR